MKKWKKMEISRLLEWSALTEGFFRVLYRIFWIFLSAWSRWDRSRRGGSWCRQAEGSPRSEHPEFRHLGPAGYRSRRGQVDDRCRSPGEGKSRLPGRLRHPLGLGNQGTGKVREGRIRRRRNRQHRQQHRSHHHHRTDRRLLQGKSGEFLNFFAVGPLGIVTPPLTLFGTQRTTFHASKTRKITVHTPNLQFLFFAAWDGFLDKQVYRNFWFLSRWDLETSYASFHTLGVLKSQSSRFKKTPKSPYKTPHIFPNLGYGILISLVFSATGALLPKPLLRRRPRPRKKPLKLPRTRPKSPWQRRKSKMRRRWLPQPFPPTEGARFKTKFCFYLLKMWVTHFFIYLLKITV